MKADAPCGVKMEQNRDIMSQYQNTQTYRSRLLRFRCFEMYSGSNYNIAALELLLFVLLYSFHLAQ